MAETKVSGRDYILLADIDGDATFKPVACLTSNSFTSTNDTIDATSKCGDQFQAGPAFNQSFKGEGFAIDETGRVISIWVTPGEAAKSKNLHHSIKMDIMRWREHEKRLGENPQGDDIIRSLELAIKNKAVVTVTIDDKKTKREFTLAPTGLANGRLRAKDKKADCERVLPVASIVSVAIG